MGVIDEVAAVESWATDHDEFIDRAEDEGWNVFKSCRGFEIEMDDEYGWFRGDKDARRHVRRMYFWTGHEMYRLALELTAETRGWPWRDL